MAAVRLLVIISRHHHLLPPLFLFFSLPLLTLSLSPLHANQALLTLKRSLSNSTALNSWVPNSDPCQKEKPWSGVFCNTDGLVTRLHLPNMSLAGEIDVAALAGIRTLRSITLFNNSLSGPIPQFNLLVSLRVLYLSHNNFSGEIPNDFFSKMGPLRKVWLSHNKFSGKIPESLGRIPTLVELRVENNKFSGPIAALKQRNFAVLNMSNNKLEGEIPPNLSKFSPRSFLGNPGLCGKSLGKECKQHAPGSSPQPAVKTPPETKPSGPHESPPKKLKGSIVGWVVLGALVSLLVMAIVVKVRRKEDNNQFDKLGKQSVDVSARIAGEAVAVPVAAIQSSKRGNEDSGSGKGGGSSRKGWRQGGGGGKGIMGDLVMVNEEKGVFGLSDLMKAAAEVLGNGGLGSAYKAMMGNGVAVAVKRMREMDRITSKDGFDAEMRRLGGLRHPNVLPPLAYYYRRDEKLLVTEHASRGSLSYNLHGDSRESHSELNWPTRLKIIKGVAAGMGFLHSEFSSYELPHGNLKSSNVLLDFDYNPLLTDYAFQPLINTTRAAQAMFAYKSPEALLHHKVTPKSDVHCLGILILEILTGKFPSQYLGADKGGTDVVQWARSAISDGRVSELMDPEIGNAAVNNSLAQMEKLLHIGAACTENDPDKRIDMTEAIRRIEEMHL